MSRKFTPEEEEIIEEERQQRDAWDKAFRDNPPPAQVPGIYPTPAPAPAKQTEPKPEPEQQ